MTSATCLPPELIAAYEAARYRVDEADPPFDLRLGERCEALVDLMAESGCSSAAFITACNPISELATPEVNRAAQAHLREALLPHAAQVLEGRGTDPAGKWPEEASYLALGLSFGMARRLGKRFGQNAIVWVGEDALPTLLLLR